MSQKTAIIVGAGPAGLTAAYELLHRTDIHPVVFEATGDIGGIAKTVNFKGNRMDMGGHRFFSKSDWVMKWWQHIMPLQGMPSGGPLKEDILFQEMDRPVPVSPAGPDPDKTDLVLLIRKRLSRIFFLAKFFDYPISLGWNTMKGLGFVRLVAIAFSYLRAMIFPRKERSLEDFFINRFGDRLYRTFFKDYTEKVWGVPCDRIKAEWGVQRIKGLSITRAVLHLFLRLVRRGGSLSQKETETSLIEMFLYPKFGPGQMWETVADAVRSKGGEIHTFHGVTGVSMEGERVVAVKVRDEKAGEERTIRGDYFFSTMPVRELIEAMPRDRVPPRVREVAAGLVYRDFITVGLLARKLKLKNQTSFRTANDLIPDTWMYIQEPGVRMGRLQVFNNWSPYMVKDPDTVWLGLEYFCNEGDDVWGKADSEIASFAVQELASIGLADPADVLDTTVVRVRKTYPAYFGSYDHFDEIRAFTDGIPNLFLVGRNGMHRYNNQDHSMLTARTAVDNILAGVTSKDNIWAVNTEEQYHELKITQVENLTDAYAEKPGEGVEYDPNAYWESTKDSYDFYPTVRHRRRFILKALRTTALDANAFVFDCGCGEGALLKAIRDRHGLKDEQLGGCDASSVAVAAARQEIRSPHLFAIPLPRMDETCDVIICSEVVERTAALLDMLRWAKDHLKPNGLLILTTQSGRLHACDRYVGQIQHHDYPALERTLHEEGFAVTQRSNWGFPFFSLQKRLTNLKFDKVRTGYLEGRMSPRRRLVFGLAHALFYVHDWIPFGPQIFVVASRAGGGAPSSGPAA